MNYHLLCTFTDSENGFTTLKDILTTHSIRENRIFIFESINKDILYYTYNIETDDPDYNFKSELPSLKDTILIHRKKESNTFYTINALNELIMKLNYGELDKQFIIPWDNYRNKFILYNNIHKLKIVDVRLKEIFYSK